MPSAAKASPARSRAVSYRALNGLAEACNKSCRPLYFNTFSRQIENIVTAITEGMFYPSMKSKMEALAARQAELEALLAASPAPSVVAVSPVDGRDVSEADPGADRSAD
ncbi:hypothetical protein ACFSM0_17585 [Rhodobacter lacus]|uniref:Uncharacterized protein n=1 Tax=Rhodobacter lacus TaxID=1641972 RepID=A0ABW5AE43_9RHOB